MSTINPTAGELTFGVEIECYVPYALIREGVLRVGRYHNGIENLVLGEGWKCEHDASVQSSDPDYYGLEIVSPKLQGAEGLKAVLKVIDQLNAWGAKVDAKCGLHVHVGFRTQFVAKVERLVRLTGNFQKALYASTGSKWREACGYCAPVKPALTGLTFEGTPEDVARRTQRYLVLNLTNLVNGSGKKTVEFRVFAGTLDRNKVAAHVLSALALVERAHADKRTMPWDAKPTAETSPVKRDGDGQTDLARFFYSMGWTKGRAAKVWGNVTGEGTPTIEDCKQALMAEARKYDADDRL